MTFSFPTYVPATAFECLLALLDCFLFGGFCDSRTPSNGCSFLWTQVAATHEMYSTEFTDEKYAAYVANFTTGDDMLFIRPSGNPMDMGQFRGMWSSGMITDASSELVSVDTIKFAGLLSCWPRALPAPIGAVCIATYTSHDKVRRLQRTTCLASAPLRGAHVRLPTLFRSSSSRATRTTTSPSSPPCSRSRSMDGASATYIGRRARRPAANERSY